MKKVLVFLIFSILTSTCFAKVILQQNVYGSIYAGVVEEKWGTPSGNGNYYWCGFEPNIISSILIAKEFKSEEDKPKHFYLGGEIGLGQLIAMVNATGGFTYNFYQNEKAKLSINASASAGVYIDLFGGIYYNTIESVDFLISPAKHPKFYGGIGLTNEIRPDLNFYPGYGKDLYCSDAVGIRLLVGMKL